MKKIIIILLSLIVLVIAILFLVNDNSVHLNINELNMELGSVYQLTADKEKVTWSSTNDTIVSVNNGLLKANNYGEANIIVSYKDKKDECHIQVGSNNKDIALTGVTTLTNIFVMGNQDTKEVPLILTPADGYITNVSFFDYDPQIIEVKDYKLFGKKVGYSPLTIKINDLFDVKLIVVVTDKYYDKTFEKDVTSIKIDDMNMYVGDEKELTYEVDGYAYKEDVKIKNENIASYQNNKIVALANGSTQGTITVNNKSQTFNINVSEYIEIKTIKQDDVSLKVGESKTINPTIEPSNATNKKLVYKVLDPTVATIDSNGVIKGLKKGSTVLTISNEKNTVTINKTITVRQFGNKNIIVGDSRTVGLCRSMGGNSNCTCENNNYYVMGNDLYVSKGAMGYNWFKNTAINTVDIILNKYPNETFNIYLLLGVNDLGNIDKYTSKYLEVSNRWKNQNIIIVSVFPVRSTSKYNVRINTIIDFNNKLKAVKNNNITYCDLYNLVLNNFNSGDGLHFRDSTNKVIYNGLVNCRK